MEKKITWFEKINKDNLDSVWYGGDIVEIDTDRYLFTISACGIVRVDIDGETFVDKNETGRVSYELKSCGYTNDKELKEGVDNGKIIFENNNWFELIIWDKKEEDYIDFFDCVDLEPNDDFAWIDDLIKDLEAE